MAKGLALKIAADERNLNTLLQPLGAVKIKYSIIRTRLAFHDRVGRIGRLN